MNVSVLRGPEIDRFRSSPALQEALAEELKQPGIAAALDALAKNITNFNTPEPIPGLHPDSVVAREFCTKRGQQQVLNTLRAMTVSTGKYSLEIEPQSMPPAFAGSIPPEYADPRPPNQRG